MEAISGKGHQGVPATAADRDGEVQNLSPQEDEKGRVVSEGNQDPSRTTNPAGGLSL